MTTAQFEQLEEREATELLRWRFEVLVRAGYDMEQAAVIAAHIEIEVRDAVDLIARGCDGDTALRILL
jgi:ketol-acid reductoisomerase